jgi:hypothetical protein
LGLAGPVQLHFGGGQGHRFGHGRGVSCAARGGTREARRKADRPILDERARLQKDCSHKSRGIAESWVSRGGSGSKAGSWAGVRGVLREGMLQVHARLIIIINYARGACRRRRASAPEGRPGLGCRRTATVHKLAGPAALCPARAARGRSL